MTAQQQLVELNSRQCKTVTDEADLRHDRARWLRDNGPALVELIEAVGADLKRRGYPAGPVLDAYLKLMPYKLTEPK